MTNSNAIAAADNAFRNLAHYQNSSDALAELDGFPLSLDRIKIPSGGALVFQLPPDGINESEIVKSFDAVILYQHPVQVYYKDEYKGGNIRPDCSSRDGITGEGLPGGLCSECPLNQFGSAANGSQGKACKMRCRIYLLKDGEIFPMVFELPTTSVREFGKYIKGLINHWILPSQVVTRFSLQKAVNANGIEYSQAVFSHVRSLTPEESALITPLIGQVQDYSRSARYEGEEALEPGYEVIHAETEAPI